MTRRIFVIVVAIAVASVGIFAGNVRAAESKADPTFEKSVRPILKAKCFRCHGESGDTQGGLDLRLRRFMIKGGESGPAIEPGRPADSLLLERVVEQEMPPGEKEKKLSKKEIATIRAWIKAGARTARVEPETIEDGLLITPEDREFWSLQPIRRPKIPQTGNSNRLRNPIDAFLLARLQKAGLTFAAPADKTTLIRRVYFDLLGLPPTPRESALFLIDNEPNAYERLVDRVLNSPHYGERWGRHWLDVAGYADSEGYTDEDTVRSHAYKFRDYVIRAFNSNMPFDQFICEQLAGDEMLQPPYKNLTPEQIDLLVATGFLRMAPDGTTSGNVDADVAKNQVVADTIQIVSSSLLGLTVSCAQCHDHRYDPIPQTDYYRFRAIFEPAYDWKNWRKPNARLISLTSESDRERSKQIELEAKAIDQQRTTKQTEFIEVVFKQELAKLPEEIRDSIREARATPEKKRTDEQKSLLKKHPSVNVTAGSLYLYDKKAADKLKKLADQAKKIRDSKPKPEFVRALTEVPGKIPVTYLFNRGDHEQPKQALKPAGLTVLSVESATSQLPVDDSAIPTSGRRLAFAKWLTSGSHPLTARVLANRIWMQHFGMGIVPTPGDFGYLGDRPTHPELLDWLASELVKGGWNLKQLHRLIMTSSAYRQSTATNQQREKVDPDNRLYSRFRLRRLEAEIIRDSILAVNGQLNRTSFGPPVPVMADRVGQFVIGIENLNAGRPGAIIPMKAEDFRRSVYIQVRRSRPLAMLSTFDTPVMSPNCDIRTSSTVALQALMLMNSDFIVAHSRHFAERLSSTAGGTDLAAKVTLAWRLAFARPPSEFELNDSVDFLTAQTSHFREVSKAKPKSKKSKLNPEEQALASFCQILLGSNEFLYID